MTVVANAFAKSPFHKGHYVTRPTQKQTTEHWSRGYARVVSGSGTSARRSAEPTLSTCESIAHRHVVRLPDEMTKTFDTSLPNSERTPSRVSGQPVSRERDGPPSRGAPSRGCHALRHSWGLASAPSTLRCSRRSLRCSPASTLCGRRRAPQLVAQRPPAGQAVRCGVFGGGGVFRMDELSMWVVAA